MKLHGLAVIPKNLDNRESRLSSLLSRRNKTFAGANCALNQRIGRNRGEGCFSNVIKL